MRPRFRWARGLFLLIWLVPTFAGGFDREEVECEEAVAYISECCPAFNSSAYACDTFVGCGADLSPEISSTTSRCIRKLDCDELTALGWCETTVVPGGVCP